MAKKKRSQATPEKPQRGVQQLEEREESPATPARDQGPGEKMTLRDYVLMNIYFDVFCLVQLVLVRLFLRETRGMYFFFAMLMIGFLIVSIFDYLYERAYGNGARVPQTPA